VAHCKLPKECRNDSPDIHKLLVTANLTGLRTSHGPLSPGTARIVRCNSLLVNQRMGALRSRVSGVHTDFGEVLLRRVIAEYL
jgi:hypothetical protein